jgi:hypothetical protein
MFGRCYRTDCLQLPSNYHLIIDLGRIDSHCKKWIPNWSGHETPHKCLRVWGYMFSTVHRVDTISFQLIIGNCVPFLMAVPRPCLLHSQLLVTVEGAASRPGAFQGATSNLLAARNSWRKLALLTTETPLDGMSPIYFVNLRPPKEGLQLHQSPLRYSECTSKHLLRICPHRLTSCFKTGTAPLIVRRRDQ